MHLVGSKGDTDIVMDYFVVLYQKCGSFRSNFRCNGGYFDRLFRYNACIWLSAKISITVVEKLKNNNFDFYERFCKSNTNGENVTSSVKLIIGFKSKHNSYEQNIHINRKLKYRHCCQKTITKWPNGIDNHQPSLLYCTDRHVIICIIAFVKAKFRRCRGGPHALAH